MFLKTLTPLLAAHSEIKLYPGWVLNIGQSDSNILFRLRRKMWHHLQTPCLIKWLQGLRIYLYPREEICRSIFLTGYYEPNQFIFLDKTLKPGMTFIDVGANMGLYALFAAKKVGPQGFVLAIEPSSREFDRLKKNVQINALTRIHLLQIAVSNCQTESELLIAVEEHPGHNTLGAFGYEVVTLQKKELVRVERLDSLIQQEKLSRVDVVKMDIEGAEFFALQGAMDILANFHPVLILELSDRTLERQGCTSKQVWDLLTEHNYCIYTFDPSTGLPIPALPKPYFDAENIIAFYEAGEWGGP
jgi:FkbM family methyltransferase